MLYYSFQSETVIIRKVPSLKKIPVTDPGTFCLAGSFTFSHLLLANLQTHMTAGCKQVMQEVKRAWHEGNRSSDSVINGIATQVSVEETREGSDKPEIICVKR